MVIRSVKQQSVLRTHLSIHIFTGVERILKRPTQQSAAEHESPKDTINMTRREMKNEQIVSLFFTQGNTELKSWVCKCGLVRQKNNSGWSNLLSHLYEEHREDTGGIFTSEDAFGATSSNAMSRIFVSDKALKIFS